MVFTGKARGCMDFLTHACMGVGAARLLARKPALRPQLAAAALFASLLPDADSFIVLVGMEWYGKYHRVVTHSLAGLICIVLVSAALVWVLAYSLRVRAWGWLVVPDVSPSAFSTDFGAVVPRASLGWLLTAAAAGAALHWFGDAITDYGSLFPFWPFSQHFEVNWGLVKSFDWPIFMLTLCWFLVVRNDGLSRRREVTLGAKYVGLVSGYLLLRWVLR
jgi:membrane-bound metal-dependent hydrolase YbcI (DUF457 family)